MNDESKIQNLKSKIAFVFPGQGSQAVGMGKDLFDNFAPAREIFAEADDALSFKISELCFAGNSAELQLTENTQPALLTVSIAAYRAMRDEGFAKPDFVAGHSLGEYSALVAAGALTFADAVRTVRMRGRFMQEAVPVGVGAMAAILGADLETIETACAEAAGNLVCNPANLNSPTQIVIAGHAEAVDRAIEILKERGARKAIKLNVSAPFHCELMKPARERLGRELNSVRFFDLTIPCVSNVEATAFDEGEKAQKLLVEQVTAPVRWSQTVEFLQSAGVETFVEVGVGKVLSGLIRQTFRDAICHNVEDAASMQAAKAALAG
jgi:[acyl-carrier-protein] S-malonyltransferase